MRDLLKLLLLVDDYVYYILIGSFLCIVAIAYKLGETSAYRSVYSKMKGGNHA